MITFYGTHGTCVDCAEEIAKNGFLPIKHNNNLNAGKLGSAVAYFWRYEKNQFGDNVAVDIAIDLAGKWHTHKLRNKGYNNYQNKSCSILHVRVVSLKMHCIDTDKFEFQEECYKILKKVPDLDEFSIYEYLIEEIEKFTQRKIAIVFGYVTPPKDRGILQKVSGGARAFAIRDLSLLNEFDLIK